MVRILYIYIQSFISISSLISDLTFVKLIKLMALKYRLLKVVNFQIMSRECDKNNHRSNRSCSLRVVKLSLKMRAANVRK